MSETANTTDRLNVITTRVGALKELLTELNPVDDAATFQAVFGLLVLAEFELRELRAGALEARP